MTSFDAEKAAKGWSLIAEGAMEISLAYSALEPASAREAVPGAGEPVPPRSSPAPAPSFDELPPDDFMGQVEQVTGGTEVPLKPQVEAGLGKCPTHGKPWTVKAAGVSKAGKPFKAFWKCAERDADGYCNAKPQRIWQDTHPIQEGAAA